MTECPLHIRSMDAFWAATCSSDFAICASSRASFSLVHHMVNPSCICLKFVFCQWKNAPNLSNSDPCSCKCVSAWAFFSFWQNSICFPILPFRSKTENPIWAIAFIDFSSSPKYVLKTRSKDSCISMPTSPLFGAKKGFRQYDNLWKSCNTGTRFPLGHSRLSNTFLTSLSVSSNQNDCVWILCTQFDTSVRRADQMGSTWQILIPSVSDIVHACRQICSNLLKDNKPSQKDPSFINLTKSSFWFLWFLIGFNDSVTFVNIGWSGRDCRNSLFFSTDFVNNAAWQKRVSANSFGSVAPLACL